MIKTFLNNLDIKIFTIYNNIEFGSNKKISSNSLKLLKNMELFRQETFFKI